MKSNQERSNGCLPPKKREILALEQRPVQVAVATTPAGAVAMAGDGPHAENLAWLASVASERCKTRDAESPRCIAASTSSSTSSSAAPPSVSAVPLASLSAVYPAALPQQPASTIQFAQLGPNVQFITSGPYAGYISSHIISTSSSAAVGQRPHQDGFAKQQEQAFHIGLPQAELAAPAPPQVTGQYIQVDGRSPLPSAPAPAATTAHLQLHPHATAAVLPQTLTLAPSQLLLQYADSSVGKKPEELVKGSAANGEVELAKQNCSPGQPAAHQHQQQLQSYEARHILLPADYSQNPAGLQTSLVLLAQHSPAPERDGAPASKVSLMQAEKAGKPAAIRSSSSFAPAEVDKSVAPHALIQTGVAPQELYSSPQPPIIGYITSANQPPLGYHATLPQHLVIPSGQPLLIPVSGANSGVEPEATRPAVAALSAAAAPQISTAMPHAYLATALSKCEALGSDPPAVAHAQALATPASNPAPVVGPSPPAPAAAPTPIQATHSVSVPSSPVTLPPFFMRGSIIQLADGELKRVEDLKTEDFIQSAEISSELKIDSSTVERIDSGQSPNVVVIQFSVGELKAQVRHLVLLKSSSHPKLCFFVGKI